jgi:TPR repeat protein
MEQMGLLYLDDKAVKRDYGRAMAWFEQAARGGSADGEYHIAFRFLNGEGIPRDYVKAMTWFKKAVADGSALADDAEDQIAQLYANGEGVPVDYHAAKTWFEKAASDGSGDAEDQLGWFYLNGKGVDVSFGQALSWFQKAAADGSEDAADQIGYLYKTGHGVKQDDAAALKAFGQALEIARKNLAANPTDPGSMGDLAFQLLLNGKPQEALDTANKAIILAPNQIWIESNKADALMMLGETGAARDIYLRYRDVQDDGIGNPWKRDVRSDFDALRKLGVSDPLMAEVTDELAR